MGQLLLGGILSALSVILGFIALLKQKTYIDAKTGKPSEIEVPLLGKLKTNYPSLVFVFLGFSLAFYAIHSTQEKTVQDIKDQWIVEGRFVSDDPNQKWTPSYLSLQPGDVQTVIDSQTGNYKMTLQIPRGAIFEDVYKVIGYTDGNMSVSIPTSQALEDYDRGEKKFIEVSDIRYRKYKPAKLKNNDL